MLRCAVLVIKSHMRGAAWVCDLPNVVREVRSGAHGIFFKSSGEDMFVPAMWVK